MLHSLLMESLSPADPAPGAMRAQTRHAELIVRTFPTGAEVLAVRAMTGAFQALAFSPDGHQLAAARGYTGDTPGSVLMVIDVQSGERVWEVVERGVHVLSLTFSSDGPETGHRLRII